MENISTYPFDIIISLAGVVSFDLRYPPPPILIPRDPLAHVMVSAAHGE